jgi:5-methylcytosine-specific restriction endonuclease McrA
MSVFRQVLVLNSTYEPVNVCSTRRALVLLLKGRAESLETAAQRIRSERASYPAPVVIRLNEYARVPRPEGRRLSRRAILARDGYRCQYCGSTRHLTVDHLVPRSRGGASSWENLVTSCAACNTRKGASLPSEVGMALSRMPRPPAPCDFVFAAQRVVPEAWRPYLDAAVA